MRQEWPGGKRHAMDQGEHERWNASHYPGTRQMCICCEQPTGRCEEDTLANEQGIGPLCEECYSASEEQEGGE